MKGHNSNAHFGGLSAEHLKQFIERIERLEEEKRVIADDIKEVFAEAKGTGFDAPTMKKIIKLRKKDKSELEEEEYLFDTYWKALGHGPLFDRVEEDENNPEITISTSEGEVKTNLKNIKKASAAMKKLNSKGKK